MRDECGPSPRRPQALPIMIMFRSIFACLCLIPFLAHAAEKQAIQPYQSHRGYWAYQGEPVLLLGANKWDAPFFLEDQETFYRQLKAAGGNYTRYILKQRVSESGDRVSLVQMFPFKRRKDGRYDLRQWNPEYWDRFAEGIRLCEEWGIIVQVTLWDRFDFYRGEWVASPWNPKNNVNYTREESGLAHSYPHPPGRDTNPYLKTVPTMENNRVVLPFQKQLIARMMSFTLQHGNVLYNMGNEGNLGQRKWDLWWNEFIRGKARDRGKTICTTSMYGKQRWKYVVESPAAYSYVEGSKAGSRWTEKGEEQYATAIQLLRSTHRHGLRPVNAVKVRTQKIVHHPQERLWRLLMAGFAALSHHRTTAETSYAGGPGSFDDNSSDDFRMGGLGFEEEARTNIRAMRTFTDIVVPWETEPHPELLTGREKDEVYLRARPGEVYGLYFPNTGQVGLDLRDVTGEFRFQWLDIAKGAFDSEERIRSAGQILTLSTPRKNEGGWAALLIKKN